MVRQILDALSQVPARTAISGVDGMAGVGKTELANVAAHLLAAQFPDAQLLAPLGAHTLAPWTAQQAMGFCLTSLDPHIKLPSDETALRAAYLNALHGKRCLLVLDDVRDEEQVAFLLPPPGCALIVTCRSRLSFTRLTTLDTLPPDEATAMLRRACPRLTEADAGSVAILCGFLPIALFIAGGHLNRNRSVQVAEFVASLSGSDRLRNLKLGRLDVNAVFEATYAALSPQQRSALRMLGVMPTAFDDSAALAIIGGKLETAGSVLQELVRRNLLNYDDKARRFRWHDLLREFVHNHAKVEELNQGKRRHAEHFTRVAQASQKLYQKGGQDMMAGLDLFDRERRHLEAAFDWLETREDRTSAILLGSLVGAAVYLSDLRFDSSQRIRWSAAQNKAARLVGFRAGEGGALGNLGLAHAEAGDPKKAIELYEQALIIHRKTRDRRAEGRALGNLGNAFADLGDARKALCLHEQNLMIARDLGDRQGQAAALGNMGNAHFQLDEALKAVECYRQQLAIARGIADRH